MSEVPDNRLPACERYHRDPQFHMLVQMLVGLVNEGVYTPTELREALILAQTIIEQERVRPIFVGKPPWES